MAGFFGNKLAQRVPHKIAEVWQPKWKQRRELHDSALELYMEEKFHSWRPFDEWPLCRDSAVSHVHDLATRRANTPTYGILNGLVGGTAPKR